MNKQEQDTVQLLQKLGTFEKYCCIYADPPWSKNQKESWVQSATMT